MTQPVRIEAVQNHTPPTTRFILLASLIVFVAYSAALGVARNLSVTEAAVGGFANAVPTVIFALVAYRIVGTWLVGRGPVLQAAGHAVLGPAYAVITYWLLIVMLGAVHGASLIHFTVEPFPTRASSWQLLQNLTTYGIVAALAYRHARPEPVAVMLADPEAGEPEPALSRYFIRSGEELKPIDVAGIVSIAGADDYAEVVTVAGRHLVRMTLAEFERSLDPAKFIRVHRSRIVNVDRIERVEPAGGGRLLLHMEDGEAISASRAGSRLLRDRVL